MVRKVELAPIGASPPKSVVTIGATPLGKRSSAGFSNTKADLDQLVDDEYAGTAQRKTTIGVR